MTSVSSSVGIIGGADGPTAIFVTGLGNTALLPVLLIAGAAVLAGVIAFFAVNKKGK